MAQSLSQKLKIKEGAVIRTINAPKDFATTPGLLPPGASIVNTGKRFNQIHWFVLDKAQMEKELNEVLALLSDGITLWIYYPKASSKIQTDLTRDKGWEKLLQQNIQWLSLVSFNDTWSAFSIRKKMAGDEKRTKKVEEKPVDAFIDPVNRTVTIPDDLAQVFKKNKAAANFFDTLSFTNKKEYVEWIVSAKKIETRQSRIVQANERLQKLWKNPSNR